MSETAMELYDRDGQVIDLQRQVKKMEAEIARLQNTVKGQGDAIRLVLAEALRRMAGELDSGSAPINAAPHVNTAWETWKQRFPGKPADMITVLLAGGEMTRDQLRVSMACGWSSVDVSIKKLRDAGLLMQNGHRYYLKKL